MRKLFLRLLEEWQRRLEKKTSAPMSEKEVETIYRLMGADEVETLVNSARLPVKKSTKL